MEYEAVIGLEVHSQLKTNSKIFCSCPVQFGEIPNTNVCPVCTGQPGVLPVLNKSAVELIVRAGLATHCAIADNSVFARKHYFYPDLPKNYQISQYEDPVCANGYLDITVNGSVKRVGIVRMHLEEDAGKLLHMIGSRVIDGSFVDYNRTGVPLIEIVSCPDINTSSECCEYLFRLKQILEFMDISDCNMEEGKLRCDANISIRLKGEKKLGVKTELKNMNSFKAVRDAVEYEIKRQIDAVKSGGKIAQETRLWNADKCVTEVMRTKEEAHDYRYFPEPDLVPLALGKEFVERIRESLGELPEQKFERYVNELKLSEYDAGVLTSKRDIAFFFEETLSHLSGVKASMEEKSKSASNFITSELLGRLNKNNMSINQSPINSAGFADMISRMINGAISGKIAKSILDEIFAFGGTVAEIIEKKGLKQINDSAEIKELVDEAINANPQAVRQYREGKERALGAVVGYIMRKTGGKANPGIVNRLLKEKLG